MRPTSLFFSALLALTSLNACQTLPIAQRPPLTRLAAQNATQSMSDLMPARTGFQTFSVVKTTPGKIWPQMELLRTPGLPEERMQDRGRQRDPDVLACFGSELPASTDVCLHDAGVPERLSSNIPVLLIHGANVNATSNWATPPFTERKTGLMQHLRAQGYRVFAVTFANKHGDNFVWANQIHTAINRIKQITGAPQVDAIAHSKGGFSLRLYVSDVLTPGMQPYVKSVRKAIFIGSPQRGIDYTFRHPVVHWALIPEDDDPVKYAPLAWTRALIYGKWVDTFRSSFGGPYFKGQAQMLARWDQTYPIGLVKQRSDQDDAQGILNNPDALTSYYGGKGLVSESPGLENVARAAGDIVARLRKSPVNADIQVAILAGNSPTLPGILNETDGPSDGLALVKSVTAAEDLTAGGARLLDQTVLPLHHMGLVSEPPALDWVVKQLKK
jgi:triacylglycerol lipase